LQQAKNRRTLWTPASLLVLRLSDLLNFPPICLIDPGSDP
jgi:hypothetical protein